MELILNESQVLELQNLISKANRIVICAHVNPDGDAVGTTLAIQHWLERMGKTATIVLPNDFPDFLRWMPGAHDIVTFSKHQEYAKSLIAEADLFIITDLNTSGRMMEMEESVVANPAPRIMIDHHLNPSDFCQLVISRPEMCASAEVFCHVLSQLGELDGISQEEATCLYAAMMCDTGAFTYASSRAEVYECVSKLLSRGIDKDRIYRNVFWTCSVARMRLQGYLLYVKMEVLPEMHAAIMTLTNEERKRFGIKNGDTEGFVNMPLQIDGTRLSIFLSEDTEHQGVVRVSLRSVDDFPCDKMSNQFFNGGGHKNASGGRLHCTIDEAVKIAHEAMKAFSGMLK